MARANRLSEQVPMKVALKEVMPTKFLPYARHVTDEVVVLDSGAIMLTFELQGRAFETADVRDLNDWHAKLNGMLRNLHDDRLSIWTHLVRARVEQYPGGNFRSRFARDLDAAYFARMNKERLFINRFFVTLALRPSVHGADKLVQLFKNKARAEAETDAIDADLLEALEDKARDFEKLMDRCSPRRLSIYGHNGLKFSETMEVAEMVMTGRHLADAAAAEQALRDLIGAGDVVLVKGSNSVGLGRLVASLSDDGVES